MRRLDGEDDEHRETQAKALESRARLLTGSVTVMVRVRVMVSEGEGDGDAVGEDDVDSSWSPAAVLAIARQPWPRTPRASSSSSWAPDTQKVIYRQLPYSATGLHSLRRAELLPWSPLSLTRRSAFHALRKLPFTRLGHAELFAQRRSQNLRVISLIVSRLPSPLLKIALRNSM
jgi:hypothetical protein